MGSQCKRSTLLAQLPVLPFSRARSWLPLAAVPPQALAPRLPAAGWGWGCRVQAGCQHTAAFWRHLRKAKPAVRGRAHAWPPPLFYITMSAGEGGHQPRCPSPFPWAGCGLQGQTERAAGTAALHPPEPSRGGCWQSSPQRHPQWTGTKLRALEGPCCKPLLHLESSGSLIVLLNINGLMIS